MNSQKRNTPKTVLILALMLTISLIACTQLTQVTAQTSGTVTINNGATYTNSTAVTLTLSAVNATQMAFSNDNSAWSSWEPYATTKNWTITNIEGTEVVYVQFQDSGNQTATASAAITLDLTPPVVELNGYPYSSDGKTVYFDASLSLDNYGIQNATWNFGDGNITYGYSYLLHTYAAVGTYNATVTLIDFAGNTATASRSVTISDATTQPTAQPTLTAQPTSNPTNTQQPTTQPTATPSPTELDPLTLIVLIGAIGIIAVVVIAIILVIRRKPKAAKPAAPSEQPPRQQPSTPSEPSESNFTI